MGALAPRVDPGKESKILSHLLNPIPIPGIIFSGVRDQTWHLWGCYSAYSSSDDDGDRNEDDEEEWPLAFSCSLKCF